MEDHNLRWTAVAVGVLFWLSNLVTLVGALVAGFIPNSTNALTGMYPHATRLVAGTLVTHVNDVAIIGYAALLFAVLKRHGEGLALGYAALKVVEGALLLVSAAMLLSLVPLSQHYLAGATSDDAAFRASADMALAQQFWAGRMATFAYLIATPILNVLLYRSRLVPRLVPIWGLLALGMLAAGLAMGVGDPTRGFQPGQLLVIPIILWELTFATWLIVRGFTVTAMPARTVSPARRSSRPSPTRPA